MNKRSWQWLLQYSKPAFAIIILMFYGWLIFNSKLETEHDAVGICRICWWKKQRLHRSFHWRILGRYYPRFPSFHRHHFQHPDDRGVHLLKSHPELSHRFRVLFCKDRYLPQRMELEKEVDCSTVYDRLYAEIACARLSMPTQLDNQSKSSMYQVLASTFLLLWDLESAFFCWILETIDLVHIHGTNNISCRLATIHAARMNWPEKPHQMGRHVDVHTAQGSIRRV